MSDAANEPSESESALRRRLEARVTELEIALSFERETRAALDEVVREFAARVETLERRLNDLGSQVSTGTGTPADAEGDDGSGYKFVG